MYLQKVVSRKNGVKISFLLASWRFMTKIARSGSGIRIRSHPKMSWIRNTASKRNKQKALENTGSCFLLSSSRSIAGSGSVPNVMDPQHCLSGLFKLLLSLDPSFSLSSALPPTGDKWQCSATVTGLKWLNFGVHMKNETIWKSRKKAKSQNWTDEVQN